MSDLIFLSALFKLVIYILDEAMNFDFFLSLMRIIICFLERPLVVILILGFIFPKLLIKLWIFLIFVFSRLGKLSLSFKIPQTFKANTWAYDCLFLGLAVFFILLLFFLKNFDFSSISLNSLGRIGEGILTTSTCLFFLNSLILSMSLLTLILEVNFNTIFCLNILLLLLALNKSYLAL